MKRLQNKTIKEDVQKNIMVFDRSENNAKRWQKEDDEAFAEQLFKDFKFGPIKAKEVSHIGTYDG